MCLEQHETRHDNPYTHRSLPFSPRNMPHVFRPTLTPTTQTCTQNQKKEMLHVKRISFLCESAVACHETILCEKRGKMFVIQLEAGALLVESVCGRYPADEL